MLCFGVYLPESRLLWKSSTMQFKNTLGTHFELTIRHTHNRITFQTDSCVCRGVSVFAGEGAYTGPEEQGDSSLGRQSSKAQPCTCPGLRNLHGCFFLNDIGRLTG